MMVQLICKVKELDYKLLFQMIFHMLTAYIILHIISNWN